MATFVDVVSYVSHYPEDAMAGGLVVIDATRGNPFVWQNTNGWPVRLFITGGVTVTIDYKQEIWPDSDYQTLSLLGAYIDLNPRDFVRISYVITAPTVKACPY